MSLVGQVVRIPYEARLYVKDVDGDLQSLPWERKLTITLENSLLLVHEEKLASNRCETFLSGYHLGLKLNVTVQRLRNNDFAPIS